MNAKKPPFAVLFDLDGVLIDSEQSGQYARAAVAHQYGFTPEEMQARSARSRSLRDFYQTMQQYRPFDADFDTFAESMVDAVFEYLKKHVNGADPQLVNLLHQLRTHGIPVAVGTAALKHSAARKLALVKLHEEFDVVVTADDVERHKPHPDVYLESAKRLGVEPANCIVIEDGEGGIQAGKAAGMKTIGYSKYIDDAETLGKADLVVDDFSKLTFDTLAQLANA